jgi:response regulator RpfG family c-di-GMP phosphodiesterase
LEKIVLGVQDDAKTVDSLARLFKQSCPSVQFVRTASAEEALEFLQAAARARVTPELVLVDMHSLGSRGVEALKALRASDSFWGIPVVMLAGGPAHSESADDLPMATITHYIFESHTTEGLMNAVKAVCLILWPHARAQDAGA